MDSFANVYEQRYAKDSFENDSDEIPEIYDSDSESHYDEISSRPDSLYAYARKQLMSRPGSAHYKQKSAHGESSSDDDKDVVISETIAEINTAPMRMDEALYSPESSPERQSERKRYNPASGYAQKAKTRPQPQLQETYAELDEGQEESAQSESEQTNDEENEDEENEDDYTNDDDEEEESERPAEMGEEEEVYSDNMQEKFSRDHDSVYTHGDDDLAILNNMIQRDEIEVTEHIASPNVNDSAVGTRSQQQSNDSDEDQNANGQEYESAGEEEQEQSNEDCEEKYDPRFQVEITTRTPTTFNSDDYPFHLSFVNQTESAERFRIRQAPRKSWSFSNARMREIERENQILLKKILTQKPTYVINSPRGKQSKKFASLPPTTRKSSAAVNRKKQQRQIDLENQGLKRRIEAIAKRPVTQNHK